MAAVGTQLRSANGRAGVSRLSMMQAKFQEKLMQEKESRLLEMAARQEAERDFVLQRMNKNSAASSLSSSMSSLGSSGAGHGRVRRLFEERRNNPRGYHHSPKGVDKSYPLDPVKRDARPPVKGGKMNARGLSMDRPVANEDTPQIRSRSQVTTQRKEDNRIPKTKSVPRAPTNYKSANSVVDGGYQYSSRGPSPLPPSSTKSSPGPRANPVTPARQPKKPAPGRTPLAPRPQNDNFLTVNGNRNSRSRSPSPTPTKKYSATPSGRGGLFSNFGKNRGSTAKSTAAPSKTLGVQSRQAPPTPRPKGPVPDHLRHCKFCERNFAPDRIDKHITICSKTKEKAKKRKVYDPVKMRTEGTEAERFIAKGLHLKENKKVANRKNNWRKKHEDFINTIRAAKGEKGYVAPPVDTSDYVDCPHCGRKFNEAAADRHIPKCKDIASNKPRKDAPFQRRR